ncbi:MAG TPA: 4'-phosphopantetheinyl transferase superfamily protein [Pseudolabrys sp.]|nr:4'-phosphopantetheinyl transferase superfamily protein [Pseudolabrys sp.]
MSAPIEQSLRGAIRLMSTPDVWVDVRMIAPGDEHALLPDEARSIASSLVKVRRASGAARLLGRALLARLGHAACAIPKGADGAPQWPDGVVGSFAHDGDIAVAAVARSGDCGAIGIDIEPAEPLPDDLRDLVVTPRERPVLDEDPLRGRVLFAAKEAVYKAVAARDGLLLDYQDIDVDTAGRRAHLTDGRAVDLRVSVSTHIVVLAMLRDADLPLPASAERRKTASTLPAA